MLRAPTFREWLLRRRLGLQPEQRVVDLCFHRMYRPFFPVNVALLPLPPPLQGKSRQTQDFRASPLAASSNHTAWQDSKCMWHSIMYIDCTRSEHTQANPSQGGISTSSGYIRDWTRGLIDFWRNDWHRGCTFAEHMCTRFHGSRQPGLSTCYHRR